MQPLQPRRPYKCNMRSKFRSCGNVVQGAYLAQSDCSAVCLAMSSQLQLIRQWWGGFDFSAGRDLSWYLVRAPKLPKVLNSVRSTDRYVCLVPPCCTQSQPTRVNDKWQRQGRKPNASERINVSLSTSPLMDRSCSGRVVVMGLGRRSRCRR